MKFLKYVRDKFVGGAKSVTDLITLVSSLANTLYTVTQTVATIAKTQQTHHEALQDIIVAQELMAARLLQKSPSAVVASAALPDIKDKKEKPN